MLAPGGCAYGDKRTRSGWQQHHQASLHTAPYCTALPSVSASIPSTTTAILTSSSTGTRPNRGFCSNCKNLEHSIVNCWKPGGGGYWWTGEIFGSTPTPSSSCTYCDDWERTSWSYSFCRYTTRTGQPCTEWHESDLCEWYSMCDQTLLTGNILPYLKFLCDTDSVALVLFAMWYNIILDLRCTTHRPMTCLQLLLSVQWIVGYY